jgi:dTDP-4-amino-4,6-dideoxygalactose transaminase
MQIPLVDLSWQHRQVRTELDRAFDRILTDPTYDDLRYARELEAVLAGYFDVPDGCVITVQSGSSAQFLALKALGLGPGDEVITVPNSDLPTTASISHTGAGFRLVDVDAGTHNMDPSLIEAAITSRTRAIVPVHMFGLPAAMDEISAVAARHKLWVVEDATLALGAEYRDVKAGLWGDIAFFSFAPRKVIGGLSNGGMVVTRDPVLARRVRLLRGYGLDPASGERPIHERHLDGGLANLVEGHNLKMDGTQAAVVLAKLPYLDAWSDLRHAIAERYTELLADLPDVNLPAVPVEGRHAWRNYVIQVPPKKRARLRSSMAARGVTTATLYAPPVHLQPVYQELKLGPGSYPVAEALANSLLALPIYPGLEAERVAYVVNALREGMAGVGD